MSSSSNFAQYQQNNGNGKNATRSQVEASGYHESLVSSVSRYVLLTRRRLKLDPSNKLYFPFADEPGKQVRSAIKIKNTRKSHVAFKFQTTAPKICFMRPTGAILAPGESIIATVFKFVDHPENNEKPMDQKSKVKFKIMNLKVKEPMDYVPELFNEHKDQVSVEQILRVVFLDVERPSPALEKLKCHLAEAEDDLEARKKPYEDTGPKFIGEGLVIDEWISLLIFPFPFVICICFGFYLITLLTFFESLNSSSIFIESFSGFTHSHHAEGRIASIDPKVKVHHVPLGGSCWKVWIDRILVQHVELIRPNCE